MRYTNNQTMSIKNNSKTQQVGQSGIVSIMVTMIMMMVISLIVVGLAQVSRREIRQATDNQLTVQAFYAAESGVNDVLNIIKSNPNNPVKDKTSCGNTADYTLQPDIVPDGSVQYTCVLVTATPSKLRQTNVGSSPAAFKLAASSGNPLASVTYHWKQSSPAGSPANCPNSSDVGQKNYFYSAANWAQRNCPFGVLRVDLVPATDMSRDGLITNTMTIFMLPSNLPQQQQSPAVHGFSAAQGFQYAAYCADNNECQLTIDSLSANTYYTRVSQIYASSTVEITGTDALGNPVQFAGDQVQIDATGRAQDVLRRILVNVSLNQSNPTLNANLALSSGKSICKGFSVSDVAPFQAEDGGICNPDP